jgi:SEC-C motif-containing protein
MTGDTCPCGSGLGRSSCCRPLVAKEQPAVTAEALMRSRFTAFAEGDVDYLLYSWDPDTRPAELALAADHDWLSLSIVDMVGGGALAKDGTVEFVAQYDSWTGPGKLHERSSFRRHEGRWVYVDGIAGST